MGVGGGEGGLVAGGGGVAGRLAWSFKQQFFIKMCYSVEIVQ